jgi:hypothetical protein
VGDVVSNFSDFIGGSGGAAELGLPFAQGQLQSGDASAQNLARTSSNFWDRAGNLNYTGSSFEFTTPPSTAEDTWFTLNNITSGSGAVTHIIIPGSTRGGIQVKLTVDGTATTYTTPLSPNSINLYTSCFGGFTTTTNTNSYSSAWYQLRGYSNQVLGIISPAEALQRKIYLPFESSFKLEVLKPSATAGSWVTTSFSPRGGIIRTTMKGINR